MDSFNIYVNPSSWAVHTVPVTCKRQPIETPFAGRVISDCIENAVIKAQALANEKRDAMHLPTVSDWRSYSIDDAWVCEPQTKETIFAVKTNTFALVEATDGSKRIAMYDKADERSFSFPTREIGVYDAQTLEAAVHLYMVEHGGTHQWNFLRNNIAIGMPPEEFTFVVVPLSHGDIRVVHREGLIGINYPFPESKVAPVMRISASSLTEAVKLYSKNVINTADGELSYDWEYKPGPIAIGMPPIAATFCVHQVNEGKRMVYDKANKPIVPFLPATNTPIHEFTASGLVEAVRLYSNSLAEASDGNVSYDWEYKGHADRKAYALGTLKPSFIDPDEDALDVIETELDSLDTQLKNEWDVDVAQDLIADALSGDRGDSQKRIAEEGLKFVTTILRKNRDYADSVFEVPELAPEHSADSAIRVRMSDKIKRIKQLLKTGTAEVAESLEDSMRDLGAYCLLWLCKPALEDYHDEDEDTDDTEY